jgi:4-hydroxybenzoate polyprenyltransferase
MAVILTIFIALCSASMALGSIRLLDAPHDVPLTILVFFATIVIYTVDRLRPSIEDQTDPGERLVAYLRGRKAVQALLILGLVGLGVSVFFQRFEVLVALVPLGLLSVWYTMPLGILRLKDIPYLKTFVVAGVWTVVTAWLPVWRPETVIDVSFGVHLLTRFLFMSAITLPFDYRDRDRDLAAGIKTLPQRLGTHGTKAMSIVLLVGFVALHALYDPCGTLLASAITAVVTSVIIAAMTPQRGDIYYSVGVDGTMMLQYALLMTLTP